MLWEYTKVRLIMLKVGKDKQDNPQGDILKGQ